MGTKNATSTVQNTVPSWLTSAYQDLISKGQGVVANNSYHPYTGGFTNNQQQAFNNVAGLAGSANGTFGQAANAINGALTPTYDTVNNYMNPYVQNVVNATMANMNELNGQQQQQVIGDAAAKGALGGNRVGVAQAELARQQNLANQQTIAGLYSDAYNNALTAAQNQQQVGLSAGSTLGQLGQTEMNTNLAQIQGQLGAGTQEQQFDYQQYLNQQGFPYQQLSWLSGVINGTGPNAGGTTTTTAPYGNSLSSILGLGLGIAGLFKKGGVVPHMAGGGVMPYVASSLAGDASNYPAYVQGDSPYLNSGIYAAYIPQADESTMHTKFPEGVDPTKGIDQGSGDTSGLSKKGASNIKSWVSSLFAPADLGLKNGGLVPHMAGGGDPGAIQSYGPNYDYSSFYGNAAGSPPGTGVTTIGVQNPVSTVPIHVTPPPPSGDVNQYLGSGLPYANGTIDNNKDQSRLPTESVPALGAINNATSGPSTTPYDFQFMPGWGFTNLTGPGYSPLPGGGGLLPSGGATRPITSIPRIIATDPWAGQRIGGVGPASQKGLVTGTPVGGGSNGSSGGAGGVVGHLADGYPIYDTTGSPVPWINAPASQASSVHAALMAQQNQGPVAYYNGGAQTTTASGTPLSGIAASQRWAAAYMNKGGLVPHYAGGGRKPSDADVASWYDGILNPGDTGGLVGNALIPPTPLTATDAIDTAAPDTSSLLPTDTSAFTGNNAQTLGAGLTPVTTSSTPFDYANYGNGNDGLVPYTSGTQFMTQPAPNPANGQQYSQNLGDAWNSLTSGHGLNLVPDVRQALIAAGAGMMASKSPFALQGIGEGAMAGMDTWFKRQDLERQNADERAKIAQQGQINQTNAAQVQAGIPLTQAQAVRELVNAMGDQYTFTPTMGGLVVANRVNPSQSQIIPYNQLAGWAAAHGVSLGGGSGGGVTAPPVQVVTDAQGTHFNVNPPAGAMPSGMAMTPGGQEIVVNQTNQQLTAAKAANAKASEATVQLSAMKNAARALPSSGVLAPGAFEQQRANVAKTLNTLAQITGAKLPFDPTQVASIEEMNKLTTQFGFNLAGTTGSDVAASVISQGVGAVPSIENTPQGFKAITALIQSSLNRTQDYANFLDRWAAATGGDLTGAQEYFNQMAPPQKYADAALLESAIVPRSQADIDSAPAGTVFNINGKLMVK